VFLINSCSGRFTAANSRKQRTDLQKTDMMLFYLRFFLLLKTDRPSSLSLLSDSLFSVLWPWHPFSRTYGVNLPSSLTTLLPLVLGFSPHLPVSVCGTGTFTLDSGFSRQCGNRYFGTLFSLPIRTSKHPADLPAGLSISLGRALPVARLTIPPASPPLSNE
jgi:hypothetical protein